MTQLRISGPKAELRVLAEDLAREALEWIEQGLLDGDWGFSYALEPDDADARFLARDRIDAVLERYFDAN